MKKLYCVVWTTTVTYSNNTWVEAESEHDAIQKCKKCEYIDYEREEINSKREEDSEEVIDITDCD